MSTSTATYQRFLPTSEAHTTKDRELLLAANKDDIHKRWAAAQTKADVESVQRLSLVDSLRYEAELTEELQDAIAAT